MESVRVITGVVLLVTGTGCLSLSMMGLFHHREKFLGATEELLDGEILGGMLGFFKGVIHGYREGWRNKSSDAYHLAVVATVGILLFGLGVASVAI